MPCHLQLSYQRLMEFYSIKKLQARKSSSNEFLEVVCSHVSKTYLYGNTLVFALASKKVYVSIGVHIRVSQCCSSLTLTTPLFWRCGFSIFCIEAHASGNYKIASHKLCLDIRLRISFAVEIIKLSLYSCQRKNRIASILLGIFEVNQQQTII